MNEIIAALQEEIETAENERDYYYELGNRWDSVRDEKAARKARLNGIMTEKYIDGLQTAVNLLEKEQARELPY